MEWIQILMLAGAGLAAGFIAGLIGLGGGVIFAPVLFFYFESTGVAPGVVAPLTIGTSLFCTLITTTTSSIFHYRGGVVILRVALLVGTGSAAAVFLMTRFVTTQPWYDGRVFQVVFSAILLIVVVRMVWKRKGSMHDTVDGANARAYPWPLMAGIGSVAGAVSAAAGVGGGVVLVPAYNQVLRLSMRLATGTSSATIVLISLAGVVTYLFVGWGAETPSTAVGYVDVGDAMLLAVPAILSARLGVRTSHRSNTRVLRYAFALMATAVAVRLIWRALG